MSATKLIKGLTNFLKLSGGTMTGSITIPTGEDITLTDAPGSGTDAANKTYVDAQSQLKVTASTIGEVGMNSLHTTSFTLLGAQGSDQIIIPVFFTLLVTRDGSTAQANSACDLFISWAGSTTLGAELGYVRRWMYNESGSRTYHIRADAYGAEAYQGDDPSNLALKIKLDSAVTLGSIDSMKVITSYYVYDNS